MLKWEAKSNIFSGKDPDPDYNNLYTNEHQVINSSIGALNGYNAFSSKNKTVPKIRFEPVIGKLK